MICRLQLVDFSAPESVLRGWLGWVAAMLTLGGVTSRLFIVSTSGIDCQNGFCYDAPTFVRSRFPKYDDWKRIRLSGGTANQSSFYWEKYMAKTSVIVRSQKKPKFKSRVVRRCFRCGRKHGYMRDFDLCRICFREFANEGTIPGIKKSSW